VAIKTSDIKSFSTTEKEEIINFFNEYGFVVINDILSKKECEESINGIWNYIETKNKYVNGNGPFTWKNNNWPSMQSEGIVGHKSVFTNTAFQVRQNEKLYEVTSEIIGQKNIYANHDRYIRLIPCN